MKTFVLLPLILAFGVRLAESQEYRGAIEGRVIDSSNANISTDTVDRPVFDTSGFYFHDEAVQVDGVVSPDLQRTDRRIQLVNNYRTLPTRFRNLRDAPLNNWDVSFVKKIAFSRRARAQFHIELYNASNYVWFRDPNIDPQNANFRRVTSQGNLPRNVQLGAKFVF